MKSIIYTEGCLKGEVLCILFGHKYVPITSDKSLKKLQCKTCNAEFSPETDESSHKQSISE